MTTIFWYSIYDDEFFVLVLCHGGTPRSDAVKTKSWCFDAMGTPGNIPNPAVKHGRSDGSRKARVARRQLFEFNASRQHIAIPNRQCVVSLHYTTALLARA